MSSIMSKSVDLVNQSGRPAPDGPCAVATPAADGDAVFEAIHAVMHLYRAPRQRAAIADEGEATLTHMEYKVLGYFCRHPGATQRDLAAHAGRDKGQLARLVGGLRERGLLDARPDPADRRNTCLHPTPGAQAAQQAAQARASAVAATAVAGFSAVERTQLLALLQRIQANLEAAR
jgi:DNA-binding MarR family transcriptional regulator